MSWCCRWMVVGLGLLAVGCVPEDPIPDAAPMTDAADIADRVTPEDRAGDDSTGPDLDQVDVPGPAEPTLDAGVDEPDAPAPPPDAPAPPPDAPAPPPDAAVDQVPAPDGCDRDTSSIEDGGSAVSFGEMVVTAILDETHWWFAREPAWVADFDRDGKADVHLIAKRPNSPPWEAQLNMFWSKGDGSFSTGNPSSRAPQLLDPLAADLDGDGLLDLLVPQRDDLVPSTPWRMMFLKGRGDRTFADPMKVFEAQTPRLVAAPDLNGDGRPDLVSWERRLNDQIQYEHFLRSYRQLATGAFELVGDRLLSGPDPFDSAVGRMDDDAHVDVVVLYLQPAALQIFPGVGDGTWRAPTTTNSDGRGIALEVADFAGDRRQDIVYTNGTQAVALTTGGAESRSALSAFSRELFAGDLNGDGRADFVNAGDGKTDIMTVTPDGQLMVLATLEDDADDVVVGIGDFDGDGRADLLYRVYTPVPGRMRADLGVRLNRTPKPTCP